MTERELQEKLVSLTNEEIPAETHRAFLSAISPGKDERIMKKKMSFSVIGVIALLIAMMAVAYAATALYRVITWQGEVSRTVDPTQTPDSDGERSVDLQGHDQEITFFLVEIPDTETAFAWFDDEEGVIQNSGIHETQKTFTSAKEYLQYMSDIQQLTIPRWLPDQNIEYYSAKTSFECKAFGDYDLIGKGQSGEIHFTRFQIDDSSTIATGYQLIINLKDGSSFFIESDLREQSSDESIELREGETAKRVTVEGMSDALLIMSADPAYPDGLIMRRKLSDPVRVKQLPLNDVLEESDDKYYQYEYVTVWVYHQDDPEDTLRKLFPFES